MPIRDGVRIKSGLRVLWQKSFIQNGFAVTALRPVPAPARPAALVLNSAQSRRFRWANPRIAIVALIVVAALAASVLSVADARGVAAAQTPKRPPVPADHRVPTRPFRPAARAPVRKAPVAPRTATVWPAAGAADIGAAPGPSGAHVRLLGQAASARLGVSGVVFTVGAAGARGGVVTASVDYSSFRNAVGAGYADRLRLVELPACALSTPALAACRVQRPIPSARNNVRGQMLTAQVTLPTGAVGVFHASAGLGSAVAAPLVLAADSGASGVSGDFGATSLSPSGSWSSGGPSGSFDWSYPIAVPPPAAGAAPAIALSYDSSSVDGRIGTTNNQSSWIGEGFGYSPGYVERTYRPCSTLTDLPAASQTGDNCWAGQILTLSLNGRTTSLVYQDANHIREQADSGDRVELLTGAGNGALSGEYWRITTPDGTQYYFGRDKGPGWTNQPLTNSAWTMPVYGAHSGDPCYSAAGFASSSCTQAWRWNLDYVEDTHGNVRMYYYAPESNYYGADNAITGVRYDRGGTLSRIDYGLRDENGTVYAASAPDQVVFTPSERCIKTDSFSCDPSLFTAGNAAKWPDTPQDQQCAQGATCNNHAPTFWSVKRLTNITTQYLAGSAYQKVDSYDLDQQFPTDADPELWLASITHTGYQGTATLPLPKVTFDGQALPNRVLNYNSLPAMPHWRLTKITTETGEQIAVSYATTCAAATIGSDPSANTSQCMPVYWAAPGSSSSSPALDYFDKYLTQEVDEADPKNLTPKKVTKYFYQGAGAAWHYDDNEVTKPAQRTWGQYRGYGEVDVKTGDASNGEPLTDTVTVYLRGMNGDTLPNGGTRAASVTDTLGESKVDDYRFADMPLETETLNGDGGALVSASITDPVVIATTATRSRTGLPALTADLVGTATKRTITPLAAGGSRTETVTDSYDSAGRLITTDDAGDGVPELCATTAYADNTTSWIRDRVAETITSQQACPAAGTAQASVLGDTRTYYDASTTLGTLPGPGDVTRADVLNNSGGQAAAFFTTSTASYDTSGRVLAAADALGHTTRTAYTPADGGVLTQTVVTNPKNQATTTIYNPDRGTAASVTDVAGHVTSATRDPLGRVTAVWLPGRTQGTDTASTTYAYLINPAGGPQAVTTSTLVDYGTATSYVTAVALYDPMGRPVQTQTAAENGGSMVTGTFYDGHGWITATDDHYLIGAAPSATVQQAAASAIDARTVSTHDGSGRVVSATAYKDGVATGTTQTVYGGDRVTVIPPAGGTTATTLTDTRGHTTEGDQYTAAPAVTGNVVSGGTYQPTVYTRDALGRQTKVQSAGSTWSYSLDMLGRVTSKTDPDTGTATMLYDNNGQVTSATDARNQTLAYTYDVLGRKTGEYSGSPSGTQLAAWVWDTKQAGKLTASVRYTANGAYYAGTDGYDGAGNPTDSYVNLPAAETGLSGYWTTYYSYSSTHLLLTSTPAQVAGVPGGTNTFAYDKLGNQVGVSDGVGFTASQVLSGYGEPAQITFGGSGSLNQAWLSYSYDGQTLKPVDASLAAHTATTQIDDTAYTYNAAGQTTSVSDTQGPKGSAPVDTQCYRYDALGRLASAWTDTGGTTTSAADSALGSCVNTTPATANLGGPVPYWDSWTFDAAGDRTGQTQHALPGATGGDTVTSYTYNTGGRHSLASTSTTGPSGSSTAGYGSDVAGNSQTRTLPAGTQNFTWDQENRLQADTTPAGTTSYVYDADGSQLVRHDPGSTTLYLPGQEVTRSTNGSLTAVRYDQLGGQTVGEAASSGDYYLVPDQHGTQQLALSTATLALTRRMFDPYGNPRGTVTGGTWPDAHGFLGKPASTATGLTDIGARTYDPALGRFLSADPALDTRNPQALNEYGYSDNDPVNLSDPTGLRACVDACGSPDDVALANNQRDQTVQANAQAERQLESQVQDRDLGSCRSNTCMFNTMRNYDDPYYAAIQASRYQAGLIIDEQRAAARQAAAGTKGSKDSCNLHTALFCSGTGHATGPGCILGSHSDGSCIGSGILHAVKEALTSPGTGGVCISAGGAAGFAAGGSACLQEDSHGEFGLTLTTETGQGGLGGSVSIDPTVSNADSLSQLSGWSAYGDGGIGPEVGPYAHGGLSYGGATNNLGEPVIALQGGVGWGASYFPVYMDWGVSHTWVIPLGNASASGE